MNIKIMIIIFTVLSCKKYENENNLQNQNAVIKSDTIINSSTILLLTPDDTEIIELKKKYGDDDFYTIADDANYYISEVNNELSKKISKTHHKIINFQKEKYVFNKIAQENKWLIIEYSVGNKPKIYSLVDYYLHLNGEESANSVENKNLLYYETNNDFFVRNIDINKDGFKDKIFSNKKNLGDNLILFLNNGKSEYKHIINSYNFSQDGGFVIDDIIPINSPSSQEVFYISTYFEGSDGARRNNYVVYENGKWLLTKSIYITSNWRENPNIEYYCEVKQNINLIDKDIRDKLKPIPDESIRDKVCVERNISENNLQKFEQDAKNGNIDIQKCKNLLNEFPINKDNISLYNNAAFYLQQKKLYKESSFLLIEILKKDSSRVVAYLNLADAYWGLNNIEKAKESYRKYIELMKSQKKDLSKIPQRVYERIK